MTICCLFLLLTVLCPLLSSCHQASHGSQPPTVSEEQFIKASTSAGGQAGNQNQNATSLKRAADLWPATPPRIGKLILKQEYWDYIKEAARKYHLSPYLIQAVCAIESRYDPQATSGRGQCIGLMQLHRSTARKYKVDPRNPRENIMGGAAVLARLLKKYDGNLQRVLRIYNAESTAAYEQEVFKAFYQAMKNGATLKQLARHRH